MPTSLLLGAGFSKWAAGLPLVSELFDFAIHPGNDREAARLDRLRSAYEAWRLQNPEANNEEFVAWAQTKFKRFDLAGWYVSRRLTDPFISGGYIRKTWYVNSQYARGDAGVMKTLKFLEEVEFAYGSPLILTTNYDMLVEYALGSKGFNYGRDNEQIGFTPYPHIQPVYASGRRTLLKLHGSLSWSADGKSTTSRHGMTGKCLIVAPMAEKTPDELFAWEWDQAAKRLQGSTRLIVFGFAFNPYDQAIRRLFSENSSNIKEIISIDKFDQTARLAEVFSCDNVRTINPDDGVRLP